MQKTKLLFADPSGKVLEHPSLLATLRQGEELIAPSEKPIPLPQEGQLVHLPGRRPVGINPSTGHFQLLDEVTVGGKTFVPNAVGALLPPGYTRTYLPGEVQGQEGQLLPQWAYTAAGWGAKGPVVWALHTDRRTHWNRARFDDREVAQKVRTLCQQFPENRVLKQLTTCANVYRCMTSRNIFLIRDEGAIPASTMCNARCVGCISEQPEGLPPASHERMTSGPSAEEMGLIGVHHLENASGRTMISFGQGCEGEPLTRWKVIADAITFIRQRTSRGSININTNGSLPQGLEALFKAGLDAVRVSLNSANKALYEAYYKPVKYGFADVEASLAVARRNDAYVALNLLIFPGVSDRLGEVKALCRLVKKYKIDQIQTRSLCIDPLMYLEAVSNHVAKGQPMGVRAMLDELKSVRPELRIGNFARGLEERSL